MLSSFRLLPSYAGLQAMRAAGPATIISANHHHNQSYVFRHSQYHGPTVHQMGMKTMFTTRLSKDIHGTPQQRLYTPSLFMSSTRLMLAPAICYMLFNDMHDQALVCFGIAALTDLVENCVPNRSFSDKYMDAIVDKILTATCFITLYNLDIITIYFIKAFIFRDVCILICASMLRYYGFSESPTVKRFFRFNEFPTLGLEPLPISKCHTFMQYLTIGTLIGTSHLVGSDEQYWFMIFMGCCTSISYSISMAALYLRFKPVEHFFSTKIAKWRA